MSDGFKRIDTSVIFDYSHDADSADWQKRYTMETVEHVFGDGFISYRVTMASGIGFEATFYNHAFTHSSQLVEIMREIDDQNGELESITVTHK